MQRSEVNCLLLLESAVELAITTQAPRVAIITI